MASSVGPKYTRLKIDDSKLTELRDEELIKGEGDYKIDINEVKDFENTTTDVPGNDQYLWQEGHYPERLNVAKEVNLWIGNSSESRGDWHEAAVNHMCQVSQKVRLYPENIDNIGLKYSIEVGTAKEPSPLKGIMSKVQSTIDTAQALSLGNNVPVNRFSPYDNPPVFSDIKPLQMQGDITFNFHFGQAGLFSGLEEVVKPIYALVSMFAIGDKTSAHAFGDLPFPSQAQFVINQLSSAVQSITGEGNLAENVKSAFKGGQEVSPSENGAVSAASGAVAVAAKVYNMYFDAVTAGGQAIFQNKKLKYNLAYMQLGNFTYGPLIVKDFSWKFDMSNIDEEGMPISGSVTLGGLQYSAKANRGQIAATMFSGVEM